MCLSSDHLGCACPPRLETPRLRPRGTGALDLGRHCASWRKPPRGLSLVQLLSETISASCVVFNSPINTPTISYSWLILSETVLPRYVSLRKRPRVSAFYSRQHSPCCKVRHGPRIPLVGTVKLWEVQNTQVFARQIFDCDILLFLLESLREVLTHPSCEAIISLDSFLTFPGRERWQVIRGKHATGPPSRHGRRVLATPHSSTRVFLPQPSTQSRSANGERERETHSSPFPEMYFCFGQFPK